MEQKMVRESRNERLRRALPYAWLKARFTETATEFSELKLAGITHSVAVRCSTNWRPAGLSFRDYVEMTVERELHAADARGEASIYEERALEIMRELERTLTSDAFFEDDIRFEGDLR